MNAATYGADGAAGPERALPAATFDGTVNEAVLHQVVTALRANSRQGNASTKNRAAVRGGSRKPWRQKGTGRARAGTIRSPLWRGGAVVFGPQPRSYRKRVPKRVRRLAIRSALNARAMDGDLAVVEPLELEAPRTKSVVGFLSAIGRESENVLFLTAGHRPNVHLSARNVPGVRVLPWGEASAYDILWAQLVLVEAPALDALDALEADAEVAADEVAADAGVASADEVAAAHEVADADAGDADEEVAG